jgi:hypothetical protein
MPLVHWIQARWLERCILTPHSCMPVASRGGPPGERYPLAGFLWRRRGWLQSEVTPIVARSLGQGWPQSIARGDAQPPWQVSTAAASGLTQSADSQ